MGNTSALSVRQVLRYGFVVAADAAACTLAVYVALFLRFGGAIPHVRSQGFFEAAPFLVVVSLIIFFVGGLYTRAWRYFGLTDIVLFGPHPGIDLRGEGYENVARFAEQVIPTLKSW